MTKSVSHVPFYRHSLSRTDARKIASVLDTPFLTSGSVGQDVEAQLCAYFGASHALLTNSWTNGAVATLMAIGIGPGDEVIVPAMTFVATANAAQLVGATPVFVDVDADTLLMSPGAVSAAITPSTRAIIPVHLYGQMVDVETIAAICGEHPQKVWLLEDAAHCFEGKLHDDRPGTHSDAALFSFYATKNITCGEGGAIVTNNSELFEAIQKTRNHGMSRGAIDRFRGGKYQHWDMEMLGMKANLPDLLAALLPPQIRDVDSVLPKRKLLSDRYRQAFEGGPLRMVKPIQGCVSAEHLFTVGVPNGQRDQAIDVLNRNGIGCTVNYNSVPSTTYYRNSYPAAEATVPVSSQWGDETLSLPLYPSLSSDLQDHVVDVVTREIYPLLTP